MNRKALTLVMMVIAAAANAGTMTDDRLLQSIRALGGAGFSGIQDIKVPAPILVAQAEENPVKTMLNSYADQVLTVQGFAKPGIGSEAAKRLGFKAVPGKFDWYPDGTMPIKSFNLRKPKTGEEWFFLATDVRGKKEVILAYRRESTLTHYLVSLNGTLEMAVVDNDGAEIPLAEAKTGFQASLDFWLKYYKKHPQLQEATKN